MFQSIITEPTTVTAANGQNVRFTPRARGGRFNGELIRNEPGLTGFTYGYVRVRQNGKDVTITGYVYHYTGKFTALAGSKNAALLRTPEPNRIGLTSAGFATA